MIVYMDLENLLKEKNISKNKLCEACNLQRTQLNNYCKVIQKHCDSYRLCRKVIEDCKSAKNPKAYQTKHQAEYQLHDSLKKELQDLGVTKIPSSNKIQKQIENLESEQAATVREKQELKKSRKHWISFNKILMYCSILLQYNSPLQNMNPFYETKKELRTNV